MDQGAIIRRCPEWSCVVAETPGSERLARRTALDLRRAGIAIERDRTASKRLIRWPDVTAVTAVMHASRTNTGDERNLPAPSE